MEGSAPARVLVTGASGFIGSAVARHLQDHGLDVVLSNVPRGSSGAGRPLDVLNSESIVPYLDGVDAVIHAAGLAHQFGGAADAAPFMAVNADGTANMMRAAAKCGVKKFVLLSSVSVYGPHGTDVVDEDFPCRPVGPYAVSKLEGERRASQIAGESGMALAILRLATVYGEGDRGNVARLMRAIDRRRFLWIGKGTNRKSLLYCGDAARACVTALNVAEGIRVYNVAAPACTVREIVDGLSASLGCRVPGWHVPSRPVLALADAINPVARLWPAAQRLVSAVDKWLADDVYNGARFARDCDFDVSVTLAEGLQRLVQSYRNEPGAPARLS